MNRIPSPARRAEIEELFDIMPAAQFRAEGKLRAALASVERDRARLERELALKDEAIALLRDCLSESEAELSELRGSGLSRMAERDGVAA